MKNKNECHGDCGGDHGHDHDYEGSYMVARNLHSIKKAVEQLIAMIDENDEVESWMEHKISVAKAALSDVRDALTYEHEADGGCDVCGSHEDEHEDDVEIEVLHPHHAHDDQFGLNKLIGGCGAAHENKRFLGSGAINENRQLVTNNSNKKIMVEAVKKVGDMIKVKAKSGKVYEFLPTFGSDLEILRCEGYGIRIKK